MQRPALDVLALAVAAAGAVLAFPRGQLAPGGVSSPTELLIVVAAVAAGSLLVGVAIAADTGPREPAGLALIVAASLVAGAVVGSPSVPPLVSSLAALVALAGVPAIVQLTLAWPRFRPARRFERRLVLGTWALVTGSGLLWILFWSPFADASCVLACESNPLAVHADARVARALFDISLTATLAAGVVAAVLALRPARFWPGGLAAIVLAVDAGARLLGNNRASRDTNTLLYELHCLSLVLIGVSLGAAGVGRIRRRNRLLRMAAAIDGSPAPGTYAKSLADALGDPALDIAYAVGGRDEYVRADGRPFAGPDERQVSTRLTRDGAPVALIVHEPAHAASIASGLGAAARLAIDNERLQAELRTRLTELRNSRGRVVERADRERLRLERDLHDGAQQRLLMLGYELREAGAADPALRASLAPVILDVDAALNEVREIGHGIYPGVLESLGLHAALDALADGSVPFTLRAAPSKRLPAPIERAAYYVVSTALRSQRRLSAAPTRVAATVVLESPGLTVRIDGVRGLLPPDLEDLEDHVGALSGTVAMPSESTLVCELPCG